MLKINGTKVAVYAKAIASLLVGVLTVLAVVISVASDGTISGTDWSAIITSIVGVLASTGAVYQVRNASR